MARWLRCVPFTVARSASWGLYGETFIFFLQPTHLCGVSCHPWWGVGWPPEQSCAVWHLCSTMQIDPLGILTLCVAESCYSRIMYKQRCLCMKRVICLLRHILIISQSRGKANSVKLVSPLARHKYSSELSKKAIYWFIPLVKLSRTVCLRIKPAFRERAAFSSQHQGGERKGIIICSSLALKPLPGDVSDRTMSSWEDVVKSLSWPFALDADWHFGRERQEPAACPGTSCGRVWVLSNHWSGPL